MLHNRFKNYTQISNKVLQSQELSFEEKGLFCYLFSKPDGWEFHYNAIKKECLEKSDDTIRRLLNKLVDKGFIKKSQKNMNKDRNNNGKFGGLDIEFTDKSFLQLDTKTTDSANSRSRQNPESVKEGYINIDVTNNIDFNNNIDLKNKKNITKKLEKPQEPEIRPYDQDIIFNQFWELFPRKRRGGKEESFRAWNKALKRENITPEQILEVVKVYANSDEVNKGYAKGCAAWLNGSCFLNEYQGIKATSDMNPVLEYFIKTYEPEEMLTNSVLRERYIRKHSSSADELLNACEGNVERAKEMINYYVSYIREKGKEFFLWDILNNFCRIHDALKYRKGGRTWEMK